MENVVVDTFYVIIESRIVGLTANLRSANCVVRLVQCEGFWQGCLLHCISSRAGESGESGEFPVGRFTFGPVEDFVVVDICHFIVFSQSRLHMFRILTLQPLHGLYHVREFSPHK